MFQRRNLLRSPETQGECPCSPGQLCGPLISLCLTPNYKHLPSPGNQPLPRQVIPVPTSSVLPISLLGKLLSFKARLKITSLLRSPLSPESCRLTRPSEHLASILLCLFRDTPARSGSRMIPAGPLRTEADFRHNRSSFPLTMAKRGLH